MGKPTFNIYQHVTDAILAELKAGTVPWRQPWSGGAGLSLPLRVTGEPYRGVNVVALLCAALARGYECRTWMTYRQGQELGGQVRKGEKSTTVVKFGTIRPKEVSEEGTDPDDSRVRGYARAYRVFNSCQIDGLDAHWYDRPEPVRDFGTESDPDLDAWFARLGVPIEHTEEPQAYYVPAQDRIHMPRAFTFETPHAYYDTLGHECAHNADNRIMPRWPLSLRPA